MSAVLFVLWLSLSSAQIGLNLAPDFSKYSILINGVAWFNSGSTKFTDNGKVLSTADGSLILFSQDQYLGSDPLGQYTAYSATWKGATGKRFQTIIRQYSSQPALAFQQVWLDGATATSPGYSNAENVISAFPNIKLDQPQGLYGYLEFFGAFFDDASLGPHIGQWWANSSPPGGTSGGPIAVYDMTATNCVVISSFSQFMSASHAQNGAELNFGVMGGVTSVPAGFSNSFIFSYSNNGINNAFTQWGHQLTTYYGKPRDGPAYDFTSLYLGYNTDHGGYYYYNPEPGKDYNQTLMDVYNYAQQAGIPYRWILLDSWWYWKGNGNGVKNWTAMDSCFPGGNDGIRDFHERTGWPITGHNRYWSNNTDYAKQNGGAYNFILETPTAYQPDKPMAMPLDAAFWEYLLSSSALWGLYTYEQDWLYNEFLGLRCNLETVDIARQWLLEMGNAAQKVGLTVQYCMPYPRHALQSVEIPAVTQIRNSDDYVPDGKETIQWRIGASSIMAHALALMPFKDNFWTTSEQPGSSVGNRTEPNPHLQACVATLTGIVTPSDGVGRSDVDLILRSCRSDGLILRASRPAASLDAYFVQNSFGKGGPQGELWTTYSVISGERYDHIFAAIMSADYNLYPGQLTLDVSGPRTISKSLLYSLPTLTFDVEKINISILTQNDPIEVRACKYIDFQLFHVAPINPINGWAVLGELGKWVPISAGRIKSISATPTSLSLVLAGQPNEKVAMHFVDANSTPLTTVLYSCTLPQSGRITLTVPSGLCVD